MSIKRFFAVFAARNREFLRDRATLGWNIVFPFLIVAGFAFAFSGRSPDLYKIGVLLSPGEVLEEAVSRDPFFRIDYLDFIPFTTQQTAVEKVQRHQVDMLVDPQARAYWVNETSPKGYMLERLLRGSGTDDYRKQTVEGREIRYVDWLIPGILGMNMMFSALYGVGYVIVRYRKNGVLKRLKATPLSAFEFLAAQLASRLWLILAVTLVVYFGTNAFVSFAMHGSLLNLLVVFALGAFTLITMGLLVAARIASEELAEGTLNMLAWPMMFLSGVWFSLEGLHPAVQTLAQIFPLTHIISAARAIMIDGAGLAQVSGQLAVLAGMSALFLAIGSAAFRWQ